jgi:hypothetical protein
MGWCNNFFISGKELSLFLKNYVSGHFDAVVFRFFGFQELIVPLAIYPRASVVACRSSVNNNAKESALPILL